MFFMLEVILPEKLTLGSIFPVRWDKSDGWKINVSKVHLNRRENRDRQMVSDLWHFVILSAILIPQGKRKLYTNFNRGKTWKVTQLLNANSSWWQMQISTWGKRKKITYKLINAKKSSVVLKIILCFAEILA